MKKLALLLAALGALCFASPASAQWGYGYDYYDDYGYNDNYGYSYGYDDDYYGYNNYGYDYGDEYNPGYYTADYYGNVGDTDYYDDYGYGYGYDAWDTDDEWFDDWADF